MDWRSETANIVAWWVGWSVLDLLWKYFLGAMVLSTMAWLYARYRNWGFQRELRGAFIGFAAMAIIVMATMLTARPVATPATTQAQPKPGQIIGHVNDFDTGKVVSNAPSSAAPARANATPGPEVAQLQTNLQEARDQIEKLNKQFADYKTERIASDQHVVASFEARLGKCRNAYEKLTNDVFSTESSPQINELVEAKHELADFRQKANDPNNPDQYKLFRTHKSFEDIHRIANQFRQQPNPCE